MGSRTWIKFYGEKWMRPGGIIEHNVAVRGTFSTLLAVVSESKHADEGALMIRPGVGFDDTTLSKMLSIDTRTWRKHKTLLQKIKSDGDPLIQVSKFNEITIVGWPDMQPPFRRQGPKTVSSSASSSTSSAEKKLHGEGEREGERDKDEKKAPFSEDDHHLADRMIETTGDKNGKACFLSLIREHGRFYCQRHLGNFEELVREGRDFEKSGAYLVSMIKGKAD